MLLSYLLIALSPFVFMKDSGPQLAVGIDLGTTYSCVYIFDKKRGKATNLKIQKKSTLASALTYVTQEVKVNGKTEYKFMPLVGNKALAYHKKNPNKSTLLYAFKRLMGLSKEDMEKSPTLQNIETKVEYKVVTDTQSGVGKKESSVTMAFQHDGKTVKYVRPVEASAEILKELYAEIVRYAGANKEEEDEGYASDEGHGSDEKNKKEENEDDEGVEVEKKRSGLKGYDNIAKVVITVPAYFTENQVTATADAGIHAGISVSRPLNEPVAAAYAYHIKHPNELESTKLVFDMGGGTLDISVVEYDENVLEVKAYAGDNFLGGENVNDCLFHHFVKQIKGKFSGDKYKGLVEKFTTPKTSHRMRLRSFVETFKIELCTKQLKNENENVSISKEFYVTENDKIKFTMDTTEFNDVCKEVFKKVEYYITDKEEGIIAKYKGEKANISKVLFVGGSSRIPKIRQMLGKVFGKNKLSYELDADTCVAEGAAWFAASLAGFLTDETAVCLVDVVTMPVGICVDKDEFVPILDMNSTVPAQGSKIFTTAYDNQETVLIKVAQGLRYSFKENFPLGEFALQITEKQPRGGPQINITVKMDKDRTLHVSAVDEATKKETKVEFNRNIHTLSDDQIRKMKEDSEKNRANDDEMRERYNELRKLEHYVDSVKSRMVGPQVAPENREKIDKAVLSVQSWLNSEKDSADKIAFMEKYENLKNIVEPLLKGDDKTFDATTEKEEEKMRDDL